MAERDVLATVGGRPIERSAEASAGDELRRARQVSWELGRASRATNHEGETLPHRGDLDHRHVAHAFLLEALQPPLTELVRRLPDFDLVELSHLGRHCKRSKLLLP